MRLFRGLKEWQDTRNGPEFKDRSVGFVPTMGHLHAGHLSLLKRSAEENSLSVLSIFINPTQFDEINDFQSYPRTFEEDRRAAEQVGVDFLLAPDYEELYPEAFRFRVIETELSQRFCGEYRPGHFDGVLTVVLKLLNLVRADRAYFGEKDYQQYLLIRDMAKDFFLSTKIIACDTVRDADGLALSSRNSRLSAADRQLASQFPKILREAETAAQAFEWLGRLGFKVDYVEDFEGRRLAAVRVGSTRLIDNIPLSEVGRRIKSGLT